MQDYRPTANVFQRITYSLIFATTKLFHLEQFTIYSICQLPYKMKYWREYYLVKCIEKHFGKINIGNLDKIQ